MDRQEQEEGMEMSLYTVTARPVGTAAGRKVYVPLARFESLDQARAYAASNNGDVRLTAESRLYEGRK